MAVETQTLSSCSRAATAEEAAYRIDRPIAPSRAGRIVALDDGAAAVVSGVAQMEWANARIYVCDAVAEDGETVLLRGIDGGRSRARLVGPSPAGMVRQVRRGVAYGGRMLHARRPPRSASHRRAPRASHPARSGEQGLHQGGDVVPGHPAEGQPVAERHPSVAGSSVSRPGRSTVRSTRGRARTPSSAALFARR